MSSTVSQRKCQDVTMGSAITLTLNGIDIHYGKNRNWISHHWLFPPGSLTDVETRYAGDVVEVQPGFRTTLNEAYFRLCHLGYSQQETKVKFEATVARWNRTADLRLSFADFHDAITRIDFAALTSEDLEPYIWDFRAFVVDVLSAWDSEDAFLEEFIADVDFALILRVLAERAESRPLPLVWHHHDLVENGWASLEDLTDIDLQTFIVNHTRLYGRLQDRAEESRPHKFDGWMAQYGVHKTTLYRRLKEDGSVVEERTTLPTAVRHMIHHPENQHNDLTGDKIRNSIELLLGIAKRLPRPLPGLP
ncbi:HEPN/Toprim-associated domain-containing protein [Arthrobacter sp. G.S.26]|uniref:HEPN/Toprim-associated domain-containing protein n=1 Tax=Arthrobacter sp. G.S.26 TaxID=3433706 RepID=UPI003D788BE0